MSAAIYAILIAMNLISTSGEFDLLPADEQQEMMIVIEDIQL